MEDAARASPGFAMTDIGEPARSAPYWRPRIPVSLVNPVIPFTRASGFYVRSWRRYLARAPGGELPVVRPTVALAAHAFGDEIVLAGFRMLRPARDQRTFARIEREVITSLEMCQQAGRLDNPEQIFVAPPPLADVTVSAVKNWRHGYERISFDSQYEPPAGEPGRERWLGYTPNSRAHAWLLQHDEPRPWLVCVHGTAMGRPGLDLTVFRARWLHESLGLNVVLPVLPLHGPRRGDLPGSAMFPGEDVLDNLHGAVQAVWDIRRLVSWIRSQDRDSPIGLTGISLGGYITSLVVSIQDGLACAILGLPVVDLADLLERHAVLGPGDPRLPIVALAKRLGRVVSPIALTPRVPREGRFIYAGLADRIVHPRHQVMRLWEHWDRPQIAWYEGGHVGFFRSRPVSRFVRQALVQSGLVAQSRLAPRR